MTIKVATINFYAGNPQAQHDADLIVNEGFDVVGIQEAHNRLPLLKGVFGPHYFTYNHDKPHPTRGSLENLSLIHKGRGLTPQAHGSYKVAPAAKPIKYAPERYLLWARFVDAHGNKRVHITTHTQPGPQDRHTGKMLPRSIPRIAGYVMGMRAIAKEVKRQRKAGWKPIVTGDLNYRRYPGVRNFILAYWSPQRVFTRLNLAWEEHAVDYIAWDKSMTKGSSGLISQSRTGSDHDWLWVVLY